MTDKEEAARVAKIRSQIRKFRIDKRSTTLGELFALVNTLADEWLDEQQRIELEARTHNCRACGRYRKGP